VCLGGISIPCWLFSFNMDSNYWSGKRSQTWKKNGKTYFDSLHVVILFYEENQNPCWCTTSISLQSLTKDGPHLKTVRGVCRRSYIPYRLQLEVTWSIQGVPKRISTARFSLSMCVKEKRKKNKARWRTDGCDITLDVHVKRAHWSTDRLVSQSGIVSILSILLRSISVYFFLLDDMYLKNNVCVCKFVI
jgi:hypothetical protein